MVINTIVVYIFIKICIAKQKLLNWNFLHDCRFIVGYGFSLSLFCVLLYHSVIISILRRYYFNYEKNAFKSLTFTTVPKFYYFKKNNKFTHIHLRSDILAFYNIFFVLFVHLWLISNIKAVRVLWCLINLYRFIFYQVLYFYI